jgi:S-adenosylmethionine hydrolase
MRVGVITLLTDFGTADGYAGVLHGVILRINPQATLVDLCHDIAAQDVRGAAFVLSTAYPYFPAGTIHVAVVDPGVGSARRVIAVRTECGTFVAPDNGLLSYVLARECMLEMVHLTERRYWLAPLSDTFHGRDVFAPVAAHLSLGVPLCALGVPLGDPLRFDVPQAQRLGDGSIRGEVLHVDRFGNLVTNVPGAWLVAERDWRVRVAGREVRGVCDAYARVAAGELLALVGSSGHLELAVRDGNAAAALGANPGTEVRVFP